MADSSRYPTVRRDESVCEERCGKKVIDPYRWLEDPDSDETKKFVEAQNAITVPYLKECPATNKFHERMTELFNYPKYSCPFKRGPRYFYYHNTGLQNQDVLYVQETLTSEPEVFIDPNTWSDDGTVAMGLCCFSENGEYLAYGVKESGSDWMTIRVMDVEDRTVLPEELKWAKFSGVAWTHDNSGFFYQRFPEPDTESAGTETNQVLNQKVYYHVVGVSQEGDQLCYETPDHPDWLFGCEISDEGRYLLVYIFRGAESKNKLLYIDLHVDVDFQRVLPLNTVVDDDFQSSYDFIANNGTVFTLKTDNDAPKYRLINVDITKPGKDNWTTLVPSHERDVLEWASAINNENLLLCYLRDVKSVLTLHNLSDGSYLSDLPLEMGSITGYSGKRYHTEMFYRFVSFLTPGIIYRCDLTKTPIEPEVFRQIEVKGFDGSLFETEQVFYNSKDGTRVPMFIVHKKGVQLSGDHPTLLYGYGGFNISIGPAFSISRVIFMQHLSGVTAIANIRGGGEYGEQWHKSGCFEKRQNAYDDFQAAAEFLINQKYTSPDKLAIMGGSNGGLLVCCCANQRPDLFKCVISQVGVLDLLRFHKFTIGHAWVTDFGNPDKDEDFQWIYKISPLHNISVPPDGVQYPAMLLLTADHDDRVVPLHSYKYISQLHHIMKDVARQTNPLMIRIEEKAGHGAGKPTTKIIEETADTYGFLARNLGVSWQD